ncbi:MAG: hypothetical protein PHE51_08265 [Eubacteriales bacterium]|nr:hypothetical protein [Eubacteriales bacterium]
MSKKYISELIADDYKEWKKGDIILIKSPTGSGKSEFIKKQLLEWCKQNQKSMLLLSNRTLLYNQQISDIQEDLRGGFFKITLGLYQTFKEEIEDYDYLVCDECHYFFEDASFNRHTDIIYKKVQNYTDGVVVLLSATPELLRARLKGKITKEYTLPFQIENYTLYKYWKRRAVPLIIEQIRKDYPKEKILYFSGSAKDAYNISTLFNDSAFICSKGNSEYAKFINKEQRKCIESKSYFVCNLLCATTALDNGINIKDAQVKHIILDVFTPVATVQCMGRKRFEDESEHINIYIKNCSKNIITGMLNDAETKLEPNEDLIKLSEKEFAKKYNKKNISKMLDLIYDEKASAGFRFEVNECMRDWYKYIQAFCINCLTDENEYFDYICKKLGINSSTAIDIIEDIEYEKLGLVLEKWEGKKLYITSDEKRQFVEEVFLSINGRNLDDRLKGYKSINQFIEDLKLPFIIKSAKDWSRTENRGKAYWSVINTGNKNTNN